VSDHTDQARFVHHRGSRTTVLQASADAVELHTRTGEVTIPYETLEWLLTTGGPAALDWRRRARDGSE
jgi:hypothetical protein